MFEESVTSIPSIWASMNSWFTPTVLFILLNFMIGAIYFTSSLANQKQQQTQDNPQQQNTLVRSPSVLHLLKSINPYTYTYRSQEPHSSPLISTPTTQFNQIPDSDTHFTPQQTHQSQTPETDTHNFFEEEREEREEEEEEEEGGGRSLDEVYSQLTERHVNRTNSDTKPASGELRERLPAKMKKSASAKSVFAHFEEADIVEARRPATVREGKGKATEADDEVDAKADDFINKFKQQLKLQRLDSIIRKKDMIGRGSAK